MALKVAREDAEAHDEAKKKAEMEQAKKEAIERLKQAYPSRGR